MIILVIGRYSLNNLKRCKPTSRAKKLVGGIRAESFNLNH
jgi:hypothetical protein